VTPTDSGSRLGPNRSEQIMPPRLNKRQQRESEELEALKLGNKSQGLDLSEEEAEPTFNIRGGGGFSNVRSMT
jgi:hypothetical protein